MASPNKTVLIGDGFSKTWKPLFLRIFLIASHADRWIGGRSTVRLHLFFHLNGTTAPFPCSRMVPSPMEITLNGATAPFLPSQWCGCTFIMLENGACSSRDHNFFSSLNGTVAPFSCSRMVSLFSI